MDAVDIAHSLFFVCAEQKKVNIPEQGNLPNSQKRSYPNMSKPITLPAQKALWVNKSFTETWKGSKRILFKKIVIMPKGQDPKLKGAICNVPLKPDDVYNILPRGADSNLGKPLYHV